MSINDTDPMDQFASLGWAGQNGNALQTVLENLEKADMMIVDPYKQKQQQLNSQLSALGKISGLLGSFRKVTDQLTDSAFNQLKISKTQDFTLKQNGSGDADAGEHNIAVQRLAQSDNLVSKGFAHEDKPIGSKGGGERTITITEKNGKKMTIKLKQDETSLKDIAKTINSKGGDIRASVVKSDSGYQLKLSTKSTGAKSEMTIKVKGDSKLAGYLDFTPGKGKHKPTSGGMQEISKGQDAKFTVDGIHYTRPSNQITNILPGLTLTLNKVSKNKQGEKVTLTEDHSKLKKVLQKFVNQYNSLIDEVQTDCKWVPTNSGQHQNMQNDKSNNKDKGQSGPLVGDSTISGLKSALSGIINNNYGSGELSSLEQLGIKMDTKTGKLSFNSNKVNKAITNDPNDIEKLFVGSKGTPGVATALNNVIKEYIGKDDKNGNDDDKMTLQGKKKHNDNDNGDDNNDLPDSGLIKDDGDEINSRLNSVKQEIQEMTQIALQKIAIDKQTFQHLNQIQQQAGFNENELSQMMGMGNGGSGKS